MHYGPRRTLATILTAALVAALLVSASPAHAQINVPPIVIAGRDQVIPIGQTDVVNLNASGTIDVDDNAEDLRYVWTVQTPSYRWLPIFPTGSPSGREAYFVPPTPTQINTSGYSVDIRLTVTDPRGESASDTVTIYFRGHPGVTIEATALLPDPNATDTDNSGTIEDDERYTINAVVRRPGQGGNDNNEWTIREGSRFTLQGTASPGVGTTGTPYFTYHWAKISAVPNRAVFNISSRQVTTDSFTIDLPDDFTTTGAIVHYTLSVTDEAGIRTAKTVRINVVEHQVPPTVAVELASPREPAQDANGLDPDNPTSRYVVSPGTTVNLVATGADEDSNQARQLRHSWSGSGVVPSSTNRGGTTSRATFTAPNTATHGQSFIVTVTVTDPTNRTGQDQILFIVADNRPPVATVPSSIATSDGSLGGTDRKGTVDVKGRGTDPDGDQLSYRWVQTDEDGDPLEEPTVKLVNADQATVSFAAPQLSVGAIKNIYLTLTVIDAWGVSATSDPITIIILGVNEQPTADAGPDQVVDPGQRVQLNGAGSSDTDLNDRVVTWSWAYTGFKPFPAESQRPLTSSDRRLLSRFLPDSNGNFRNPLANINTPGPSFTAPRLGGLNSVQLTFTLTVTDTSGATGTDTVTITVASNFFSSYIDGPEWCTNYSLGGPRTYPVDSNPKDGVADVCSLPSTRREAVARQNALNTLASLDADAFLAQVRLACRQLTDDYGDNPADLATDVCATGQLTPPPAPVSQAEAALFYSSYIDSPDWCTNYSLGGARTYAHDSNPKDGVADVCSLPYTRREAVARQNALETYTSPQAVFNSAVALACRRLGATVFEGDDPADLARDICS
ncbi:MAG: hypothetical protein OXH53_05375 [bacterium]|nr:hypothetical protein [bacterium]